MRAARVLCAYAHRTGESFGSRHAHVPAWNTHFGRMDRAASGRGGARRRPSLRRASAEDGQMRRSAEEHGVVLARGGARAEDPEVGGAGCEIFVVDLHFMACTHSRLEIDGMIIRKAWHWEAAGPAPVRVAEREPDTRRSSPWLCWSGPDAVASTSTPERPWAVSGAGEEHYSCLSVEPVWGKRDSTTDRCVIVVSHANWRGGCSSGDTSV